MQASLSELLSALPDAKVTAPANFNGVSTNSKTVERGQLFVALRGERFDGHQFIDAVAAAGIAIYVGDPMTVSTLTTLKFLVIVTVVSVFLLRRVGLWFTALMVVLSISAHIIAERSEELQKRCSPTKTLLNACCYERSHPSVL
mgnify:CR=1 FL=1